ncbi:MAG: outer membrane beta-barrel protein [Chitinophagaceae bacterium]|nr:outer membrane beta-barrel protein [Chitinophagaceae bacterium]
MKKFFSLLAATVIVLSASAQNGKITGSIKDGGNQKTIDAATISLLNASDSTLLKTAVTDSAGNFIFENLQSKTYLISATSVGHAKVFSKLLEITAINAEANAGVLQLVPVEKNMNEVTVTATKPFIERKLDKTIINVDASISNVGATAMEVLEKSPGITVDKDGNISLKGKQGVKIFIDGKPSYLSGSDLANMLKNMSAAQLDQIEIMTNPSAKYDAAGNSGVINIKTKKTKTVGFNGSITSTYSQGRYAKFNESINLNYRNKNVNLFGNYTYRNSKGFNTLTIQRKFRDKDSKELLSVFDQQARFNNINESNNAKLGIDITLSKKATVGAVVSGYLSTEKFNNYNNTYLKNKNEVVDSRTFANIDMKSKWENFNGNVNLRHVFDSTGKELTVDLDYINYGSLNRQVMSNHYFDANDIKMLPSDTLNGNIPSDITIYSAKADYSQNFKGDIKMEAGVKASFVKTDNNARYDSLINGNLVMDAGRSNHFIYDEQIQAAYVNFNKQLNKKSNALIMETLIHSISL